LEETWPTKSTHLNGNKCSAKLHKIELTQTGNRQTTLIGRKQDPNQTSTHHEHKLANSRTSVKLDCKKCGVWTFTITKLETNPKKPEPKS